MSEFAFVPTYQSALRSLRRTRADEQTDKPIEARVKRECADLYPGIDPRVWYHVVMDGEYTGDMEGFWIQVGDWVTYVLSKHFDVQARSSLH